MYRWIWERLPGGKLAKALVFSGLVTLVVLLLFTVIFPWLELSFFAPPTIGN